ncbi:MAG: rhodanese-like domain-containing protein [Polyangiales bacterium]
MIASFLVSLKRIFGLTPPEPDLEARRLVDEGAYLLDVRSPGEYSGGHLDGSLNIPVQKLGEQVGELDTSRAVVVYCRSGMRSRSAASMLEAKGFDVYDLGRMSAWGA